MRLCVRQPGLSIGGPGSVGQLNPGGFGQIHGRSVTARGARGTKGGEMKDLTEQEIAILQDLVQERIEMLCKKRRWFPTFGMIAAYMDSIEIWCKLREKLK
jgi:hypothetical protein